MRFSQFAAADPFALPACDATKKALLDGRIFLHKLAKRYAGGR